MNRPTFMTCAFLGALRAAYSGIVGGLNSAGDRTQSSYGPAIHVKRVIARHSLGRNEPEEAQGAGNKRNRAGIYRCGLQPLLLPLHCGSDVLVMTEQVCRVVFVLRGPQADRSAPKAALMRSGPSSVSKADLIDVVAAGGERTHRSLPARVSTGCSASSAAGSSQLDWQPHSHRAPRWLNAVAVASTPVRRIAQLLEEDKRMWRGGCRKALDHCVDRIVADCLHHIGFDVVPAPTLRRHPKQRSGPGSTTSDRCDRPGAGRNF